MQMNKKEIEANRLEHAKTILRDEFGGNGAKFAAALSAILGKDLQASIVNRWFWKNDNVRPIGPDHARLIESTLGLKYGSIDQSINKTDSGEPRSLRDKLVSRLLPYSDEELREALSLAASLRASKKNADNLG